MPNVMVALPNIGGALCSTPQSLADAHYQMPIMPCSNGAKAQNPLKFAGVPQPRQQISAVSAMVPRWRSSPYYEDMWRTYRCLTSFFPIVDTCLSCEDIARQSRAMVPRWRLFGSCISNEQFHTCIINFVLSADAGLLVLSLTVEALQGKMCQNSLPSGVYG